MNNDINADDWKCKEWNKFTQLLCDYKNAVTESVQASRRRDECERKLYDCMRGIVKERNALKIKCEYHCIVEDKDVDPSSDRPLCKSCEMYSLEDECVCFNDGHCCLPHSRCSIPDRYVPKKKEQHEEKNK